MADDVLRIEIVGSELGGKSGGGNGITAGKTGKNEGNMDQAMQMIASGNLAGGIGKAVGVTLGSAVIGLGVGYILGKGISKALEESALYKMMKSWFKEGAGSIFDTVVGLLYIIVKKGDEWSKSLADKLGLGETPEEKKQNETPDIAHGEPMTESDWKEWWDLNVKGLIEAIKEGKVGEYFKDLIHRQLQILFNHPEDWITSKLKPSNLFKFPAGKDSWGLRDLIKPLYADKLNTTDIFNFGGERRWYLSTILSRQWSKLGITDIFRLPNGVWNLTDLITVKPLDVNFNFPDPAKAGKKAGEFFNKMWDDAWDHVIEKNKSLLAMAEYLGLSDPNDST